MNKFMKKFYFLFIALFLFCINANAAEYNEIKDGTEILYNKKINSWEINNSTSNKERLIKYKSFGCPDYSVYYKNDKPILVLNTNFEFIQNGTFYAINKNESKYYKIKYNGKKFKIKKLSKKEINSI